ncbi:MAG: coproporphyrinogen-III oxidase family protein [Spirochaetota bacterium]
MTPRGLYLHIPFCTRKCDYCAFHSVTAWTHIAMERIVDALLRDIDAISPEVASVSTLYIGGGTPTVLEPDALGSLIARARRYAPIDEVTVEANPGSVTAHLEELDANGVTRLSIGVQTLEPAASGNLGRRLTSIRQIERIRARWKRCLSVDLIHGVPGETRGGFLAGIDRLAAIGVDHVSVYGLGVEPGTPLASRVARGITVVPAVDDYWPDIVSRLEAQGLHRYEVSNFARPDAECAHNLNYWRGEGYIGLGPSAVSTVPVASESVRFTQPSDHAAFLARRHVFDCDREPLGVAELRLESLILGLRTREGLDLTRILDGLERERRSALEDAIGEEQRRGTVRRSGRFLYPTDRGLDLLDRVVTTLAASI